MIHTSLGTPKPLRRAMSLPIPPHTNRQHTESPMAAVLPLPFPLPNTQRIPHLMKRSPRHPPRAMPPILPRQIPNPLISSHRPLHKPMRRRQRPRQHIDHRICEHPRPRNLQNRRLVVGRLRAQQPAMPPSMLSRVRQHPHDRLPQDRAEPPRREHRVLSEPVAAAPVPVALELCRRVRLVDLDA